MKSILMCLLYFFRCYFLDDHDVSDVNEAATKRLGDGFDEFGYCKHCKNLCHKDNHMYGHEGWKKEI